MSRLSRWQDLVLPLSLIASVLVIIVPLPAAILDILLATNITLSVVVLLTTVYVRTPLEFNIFPSMLLATTLGRLVLNVASTRLILTHGGHDKMLAAGKVPSYAVFQIKDAGEWLLGMCAHVGVAPPPQETVLALYDESTAWKPRSATPVNPRPPHACGATNAAIDGMRAKRTLIEPTSADALSVLEMLDDAI